jgi:hypothetical protein
MGKCELATISFFARGATGAFILRLIGDDPYADIKRESETEAFYRFVGSAYVHGRMDGEALREGEMEGGEEETLFLI